MKVLWIALVWPEPESSAAGVRTTQLIMALKDAGHVVKVCSPCRDNDYRTRLEQQGIATASFAPNDPAFDAYLLAEQPEVVFFDRFMAEEQFAWRVREHCPEAVRILDTIDLHSLRRARHKALKENRAVLELNNDDLSSEDAIREVSAIYRSDLSLIVSDAEIQLLREHYHVPDELLSLSRLFYPTQKNLPDFQSRKDFVVIGNFNHPPNADSYRVLQQGLWKKIRNKLSDLGQEEAELHIYGSYPSQEFLQQDDAKSGFRVKGWAEDSMETIKQYRVNLAPLRFGAGVKGKIAEGWAAGTPCIGTSIAAEGLTQDLPFGGFVEDDWDQFAAKAAALYLDRDLWAQAQAKGSQIIRELYNKGQNVAAFLKSLEDAIENRNQRRLRNFVGTMLWHHQHRSTEFFSRWIEVKNLLTANAVGSLPSQLAQKY